MVPGVVDTIVKPSEYGDLSDSEFCERFVLPMISKIRKIEGQNIDGDWVHLRLSAYPTFEWQYAD